MSTHAKISSRRRRVDDDDHDGWSVCHSASQSLVRLFWHRLCLRSTKVFSLLIEAIERQQQFFRLLVPFYLNVFSELLEIIATSGWLEISQIFNQSTYGTVCCGYGTIVATIVVRYGYSTVRLQYGTVPVRYGSSMVRFQYGTVTVRYGYGWCTLQVRRRSECYLHTD